MRKLMLAVLCLFLTSVLQAQNDIPQAGGEKTETTAEQTDINDVKYRRSSLYSILIKHPEQEFADEIAQVFNNISIPEKFNNHDLSIKSMTAAPVKRGASKNFEQLENIQNWVVNNAIGRRLVAKWFDYDKKTGTFDLEFIKSRGLYNANFSDIKTAQADIRGYAMLADAGEELIGNTFVIFNDIKYVNKAERAAVAKGVFNAAAVAASVAGSLSDKSSGKAVGNIVSAASDLGANISDLIAGFSVEITSYLYRSDWNEGIAATFYENYYNERSNPLPAGNSSFDQDKKTFTMRFVGAHTVKSGETTLKGVSSEEEMIRKVCIRAIDKSIAELQRNIDEFKVKTLLYSVSPLTAKIGIKEGVDDKTKFQVLEQIEDESGSVTYKEVGVIKPAPDKIWDNRYLAIEDGFAGADLGATEFIKISGGEFYPGMLIKEIK